MKAGGLPLVSTNEHVENEIPWYVNGTAEAGVRQHIERHVEHCDSCRRSLELETRLASLIRGQHETLECAPQSGWRHLAMQLDAASSAKSEALAEEGATTSVSGSNEDSGWLNTIRRAAVPAVMLAQAAAIAVLAIALSYLSTERWNAPYRTLTQQDVSVSPNVPTLRIVFAAEARVRINELLGQVDGTIRAGPSAHNVYTIELAVSEADEWSADRAAEWLRVQPEVLFAEPVGPPASATIGKADTGS